MNVQFFARLREQLGSSSLTLPDADCPTTVGELRELLCQRLPEGLGEALADPNVICAVNQVVSGDDTPIDSNTEIAFFPPVTGG